MAEIQKTVQPNDYFNEVVPKILHDASDHAGPGGMATIRLFGDHGGVWTIDLDQRRIRRGKVKQPDFYLEMGDDDFAAMLAAELDLGEAYEAGRIRWEGNTHLLGSLSTVLQPVD